MDTLEHCLPRYLLGDALTAPPDNENLRLKPDWMTTAELLQVIQREQARLRRAVAADPRLLTCPQHRREWEERLAIEQCALWHIAHRQEA